MSIPQVLIFDSLLSGTANNNVKPTQHTFLNIVSTILPPSAQVLPEDRATRSFRWTMSLGYDQNCQCRAEPLALPSSYGHHVFRVGYSLKLSAKKQGRFGMGTSEKYAACFMNLRVSIAHIVRVGWTCTLPSMHPS
jgi:hypothetical protein